MTMRLLSEFREEPWTAFYDERKRELELAQILLGMDEMAFGALERRIIMGVPTPATPQEYIDWQGIKSMLWFEGYGR